MKNDFIAVRITQDRKLAGRQLGVDHLDGHGGFLGLLDAEFLLPFNEGHPFGTLRGTEFRSGWNGGWLFFLCFSVRFHFGLYGLEGIGSWKR
jgi:hypothetical protein